MFFAKCVHVLKSLHPSSGGSQCPQNPPDVPCPEVRIPDVIHEVQTISHPCRYYVHIHEHSLLLSDTEGQDLLQFVTLVPCWPQLGAGLAAQVPRCAEARHDKTPERTSRAWEVSALHKEA